MSLQSSFGIFLQNMQNFVARYPSQASVEYDTMGPNAVLSVSNSWGQTNANPNFVDEKVQEESKKERNILHNDDDNGNDGDKSSGNDDDYNTGSDDGSVNDDKPVASTQQSNACFTAEKSNIPISQFGHLPKPFINVGMPKMGSSSLQSFFKCGGISSSHYLCGKGNGLCAKCIKDAIRIGQPPLSSCGNFDAYTQLDDGTLFPQIEFLNEIHQENPNATFVLPFRDIAAWYHSITNWPPKREFALLSERMKNAKISGFPPGKGKDADEFAEWFCNHVQNIRDFVVRYPSHALVEYDIMDPNVSEFVGSAFGIKSECWGQTNANPNFVDEKVEGGS